MGFFPLLHGADTIETLTDPCFEEIAEPGFVMNDSNRKFPWFASLAIFVFVFLAAFAVRFHNLDRAGLWLDEVLQLESTTGSFSNIWKRSAKDKPPLDYYIQWFFVREKADEWHARLHACLIGSAAVVGLGLWGRAMGGWSLSLIVMCLALFNPLMIRFSQDGRPYSLLVLTETLFLTAAWKTFHSKHPLKPGRWIVLSLTVLLSLWTFYLNAAVCIVSALFAGIWIGSDPERKKRAAEILSDKKKWIVPGVCLAAALAAGIPVYFRAVGAVTHEYPHRFGGAGVSRFVNYLDTFAMGYEWHQTLPGAGWVLLFLMIAGYLGWRGRRKPSAALCLFLLVCFFPGIFLFYLVIDHWMEVRYTLAALPAALMLAAMGIETLGRMVSSVVSLSGRGHWKIASERACVVLMCIVLSVASFFYVVRRPVERIGWGDLARRLKGESNTNTVVVIGDFLDHVIMKHYSRELGLPCRIVISNLFPENIARVLEENEDVWVAIRGGRWVPRKLRSVLIPLRRVHPPFTGLDVRRKISALELARKRPELKDAALGDDKSSMVILPGEENSLPFLGRGWDVIEDWGEIRIRSIDGPVGEIFLPLEETLPLSLVFRLYPYLPEREPPLEVTLRINGREVSIKPMGRGWTDLEWTVGSDFLRGGINVIHLVPNRFFSPAVQRPGSHDYRRLSVRLERLSVKTLTPEGGRHQ